jgi:hypothetical protein
MPESDVDNWNADMDAWGLTGARRTHHLNRLHAYHLGLYQRYTALYERTSHAERWLALAALVVLILSGAQLILAFGCGR